ncbi:hypothetical protein Tsubulata_021876 [Turnera subulata]|uniref:CASP-like protein n=1 Tax=Turnera subulata TaxID=218843 RepID=A0A9Q0F722_9ROSI|nr:hypothetical protein Tsubulata_021876 [Turnera subulata]
MKDFAGTPGTFTGFALRLVQCAFAAGSITAMATTASFFNYTAFCYKLSNLVVAADTSLCSYMQIRSMLPDCFNGFASDLELWTCIIGCICLSKKEGYSQCHVSQPFRGWRLGSLHKTLAFLDSRLRLTTIHTLVNHVIIISQNHVFLLCPHQVTAILSLAAASSSAGITVLYFHDLGRCNFEVECQKYQMSVALAFLNWITISTSSLIMLWLLASE